MDPGPIADTLVFALEWAFASIALVFILAWQSKHTHHSKMLCQCRECSSFRSRERDRQRRPDL